MALIGEQWLKKGGPYFKVSENIPMKFQSFMIYSLTYSRDFIYFQFFMGYTCSTRNFRVRVIFLISAKFWLERGANHGLSLDGATLFRGCCNINQTKCEKSLIQSNFQTKHLHFHFKRMLSDITCNLFFITKKNNLF